MESEMDTILSLSLGALGEHLGYHMQLAHGAMRRDIVERLAGFDLTRKQYGALTIIALNEGVSQIDIAATLHTDRSTMMALIDRLEKRKLIIRRKSRADGRRQELRITPEGSELLAVVNKIVREHDAKFSSRFSPAELEALFIALKRIQRAA